MPFTIHFSISSDFTQHHKKLFYISWNPSLPPSHFIKQPHLSPDMNCLQGQSREVLLGLSFPESLALCSSLPVCSRLQWSQSSLLKSSRNSIPFLPQNQDCCFALMLTKSDLFYIARAKAFLSNKYAPYTPTQDPQALVQPNCCKNSSALLSRSSIFL